MANREMKDSGIEWIGEIPENWEVRPIYLIFDEVIRKNYDLETINALKFNFGTIVKKNNFDVSDDYVLNTIKNYTVVDNGNIMINGLNLNYDFVTKRVGMVTEKGAITSAYLAIKLHKDSNCSCKYMTYLLKSYDDCRAFHGMGEGVRKILSFSELKKKLIILPLLSEQKAIADYLDTKCAEIDSLKADITEQIEVLKQYKQSVITEAVTKGLDPDVPMKDSGIEWIGEIPESWEVSRVKYVTKQIGSGTTPTASNMKYYDGDYNWIQSGDIYDKDIISTTEKTVSYSALLEVSSLRVFKSDFIVIAMYGASVGNVAISKIDACTNQACCVLKTDDFYSLKYLYYVLKSSYKVMIGKAIGGTQPNISQILIKNLNVLLPPLEEQKAIADYLDAKCAEIDQIIESKGQQLEALEEYKKSMIYEYVTGKKEVPQEV